MQLQAGNAFEIHFEVLDDDGDPCEMEERIIAANFVDAYRYAESRLFDPKIKAIRKIELGKRYGVVTTEPQEIE